MERIKYDDNIWTALARGELDASRPIIYAGNKQNAGGHCFFCDGYDNENRYHFNCGWYGEKVVIRAQMLGLNTCWVGLSFSKQPDQYKVEDGETLGCVVSLGYGANQGVQHPQKRTIADVTEDLLPTAGSLSLNDSVRAWRPSSWPPPLSTSRNSSSCSATATAWRPRRSSPSSAMLNSTSASPSTTSMWEPGKRISNGRKIFMQYVMLTE